MTSLADTLRPLLGAHAEETATAVLCSQWYDDLVEHLTATPEVRCPAGLRLCGVPCRCEGRVPSHYPRRGPEREATLLDVVMRLRAEATGRAPSEGVRRGLRRAADLVESMRGGR